jgi:signal transduction histidine kinase
MGSSAARRYGFALVAVAIAEALAVLSDRYLHTDQPVASFLAAIMVTGWYAGTGPVALATVGSSLVLAYDLYLPTPGHPTPDSFPAHTLAWFLVFAFLSAWFSAGRRKAAAQIQAARDEERALEVRFGAILGERTRLAREIHDTLLQGFTGVALKLVAVTNRVEGQPELRAALDEVVAWARRTLLDARRAVWDMRSPEGGGEFEAKLRAASEDAVRDTGVSLEYRVAGAPVPLDREIETVIFRIALEALANVVKHAGARTARLSLSYGGDAIRLSVADDGRGFALDPDFGAHGGHWGLLGMRERAHQIGGRLSVRSTPGVGTEVALSAPSSAPATSRLSSSATRSESPVASTGPMARTTSPELASTISMWNSTDPFGSR